MNPKENKLKLLIKQAIREVFKEELGIIIKEVMSNTAQLTENRTPITRPPTSPRRSTTPVSQRVHLESPIGFEDESFSMLPPIQEQAAAKISKGMFDTKSLMEFVSPTIDSDPEFRGIDDAAVDDFINNNFSTVKG